MFGNCQSEFECQCTSTLRSTIYNMEKSCSFLQAKPICQCSIFSSFPYVQVFSLYGSLQFTCMKKKKKPIINKIHIIMSALLLFNKLAIICAFPRLYIREINWYLSWLGCSICAFLVLQGYTAFQCHCPYRHWIIVLPLQVLEYIAYVV